MELSPFLCDGVVDFQIQRLFSGWCWLLPLGGRVPERSER